MTPVRMAAAAPHMPQENSKREFTWQCELHSASKSLSGELITIICCSWYAGGASKRDRYTGATRGRTIRFMTAVENAIDLACDSFFTQSYLRYAYAAPC